MRYFIVWQPRHSDLRPYIVSEVIAESDEDARVRGFAGDKARVLTQEALLSETWGRRAYADWLAGDDWQFEEDMRRGMADVDAEDEAAGRSGPRPTLRVVTYSRIHDGPSSEPSFPK
jgi:hypothetical protein